MDNKNVPLKASFALLARNHILRTVSVALESQTRRHREEMNARNCSSIRYFNARVSEYMRLYRCGWRRIKTQETTNKNISYENGIKYRDGTKTIETRCK